MKVAIGFRLQEGPFGGGNQFAKSLVKFLESNNVKVVFDLRDENIDLILLTDPRVQVSSSFGALEIFKYLRKKTIQLLCIGSMSVTNEKTLKLLICN